MLLTQAYIHVPVGMIMSTSQFIDMYWKYFDRELRSKVLKKLCWCCSCSWRGIKKSKDQKMLANKIFYKSNKNVTKGTKMFANRICSKSSKKCYKAQCSKGVTEPIFTFSHFWFLLSIERSEIVQFLHFKAFLVGKNPIRIPYFELSSLLSSLLCSKKSYLCQLAEP